VKPSARNDAALAHRLNPDLGRHAARRIKWLTVETRAQALDAAVAGVALVDMAYIATPVAEGRLEKLAERPLQLPTGYYFVNVPNVRTLHLLNHLRDWAVEAARPFRAE
jgi:hypothetical protein